MKSNVGYTRPELLEKLEEYQAIRDCMEGEYAVKGCRSKRYLPETDPFMTDIIRRDAIYEQYKMRPPWYGVSKRTRNALVGEVFRRSPEINIPYGLKLLENDIDGNGMTMIQQMRKALAENIDIGRGGLLTDYTDNEQRGNGPITKADIATGNVRPVVVLYRAEDIVNWRELRIGSKTVTSKVILEESYVVEDDGYEEKLGEQRRELALELYEGGTFVTCTIWRKRKVKKTGEEEWFAFKPATPLVDFTGKAIPEIPFFPFGSEDNNWTIDPCPMTDISCLNFAHFRVSADLYTTAFMSAHAQLTAAGLDETMMENSRNGNLRIGPNTAIIGSSKEQFMAAYISAPPNTLNNTLIEMIEKQLASLAAKLIREGLIRKTATQAIIEESAETSTLTNWANNISMAYAMALKAAAQFTGDNQDGIICKLNTQFNLTEADSQEVLALVTAKDSGVISLEETRALLKEKGIATQTYEDYLESIRTQPSVGTSNAAGGGAEQKVATEF